MQINHQQTEVLFSFKPEDYFLVYSNDDRFGGKVEDYKVWSLNYRIDRSYKGKDDDIGVAVIYLTREEAEPLKKIFSWIEL